MDLELAQPLLSERHRSAIMTRTIGFIGWFIIVLAFIVGASDAQAWWEDALPLLGIGAVFAGAHWFLAPRRYNVYEEQLVIAYGKPRERVIPFDEISQLQVIRHLLGGEIRIHRTSGRAVSIQPWHPQRFLEAMEQALNRYRGVEPESEPPPQSENEGETPQFDG